MQKHDRHALAARVPVPETGVGNLRHAVLGRNLRGIGMGFIGLATVWPCAVSIGPAPRRQAAASPMVRRNAPAGRAQLEEWLLPIVDVLPSVCTFFYRLLKKPTLIRWSSSN